MTDQDDLLNDPIIRLLMASYGVSAEMLHRIMTNAKASMEMRDDIADGRLIGPAAGNGTQPAA